MPSPAPLLLAAALAAATPSLAAAPPPALRAAQRADTVAHLPRLDALKGLAAFLDRAGQHSAILRPTAWLAEFHPLLPTTDVTSPGALGDAGIDAAGPATISMLADGRITCTRLSDAKAFDARARVTLASFGETGPARTAAGTTLVTARQGGQVRAGYALRGREACAFASTGARADALQREAQRLVAAAPRAEARLAGLPGVLHVVRREGVLALDGTASGLTVHGTARGLALPRLRAGAPSPYAGVALPGLLTARATLAPADVPAAASSLRAQLQAACPSCPEEPLAYRVNALAAQLTGHVLLAVADVKVQGSLREPRNRFFAPRQALAAEVKDADAVRALLDGSSILPGARRLPDGVALSVPGGTLTARLAGRHLLVGNHAPALDALAAAVGRAAPGPAPHGAEFTLDPRLLAAGLRQVSLLDVGGGDTLAALFAASAELGPLLSASERATGWLDSGATGAHRFSFSWTLP